MLLIETIVKDAGNGKGLGLFTVKRLEVDTFIWIEDPEFDRVFTDEYYEKAPPIIKRFLSRYASHEKKDYWYTSPDNGKFMNHSDNPNCSFNEKYGWVNRDVEAGEELTGNYREFDIDCAKDLGFENKE